MSKKVYRIILTTIIILAFIIRLAYTIKMPYYKLQHDIYDAGSALSYVFTIYHDGKLPDNNNGQFYHPPLHHILSAGWLKIIDGFYKDPSPNNLFEGLQYLTLIYSMLIIYVTYKIFGELKFSKKIKLLLTAVIAFYPSLIILSGSLNNDELCLLLMLWTILRLIKWHKNDSKCNTIILALTTGLCVMTKMVGAIIAFPIIIVFIQKFYTMIKNSKNKKKTFIKYLFTFTLFGLISLPIGLWYIIRNYILFDQNLFYIRSPGPADIGNPLYIGHKKLWQRFSPISSQFFTEMSTMYCNPYGNHNVWAYLIKCSIFGEWDLGTSNIIYTIALSTNVALIVYTLFCIVKNVLPTNKNNIFWKRTLALTWLALFISYIKVNLKLPFGCTMDFRYLFLNLFIGLLFIGFELTNLEKDKKTIFKYLYPILIILFLLLLISTNFIIFDFKFPYTEYNLIL